MKGNDSEVMTVIKVITLTQEGKDRMARDDQKASSFQGKEGKDSEERKARKGVMTTGKDLADMLPRTKSKHTMLEDSPTSLMQAWLQI